MLDDIPRQLVNRRCPEPHGLGKRGSAHRAEGPLEPRCGSAHPIQVRRSRNTRRLGESSLEIGGRGFGLLDSLRLLRRAKLCEPHPELGDVPARCTLLGELAEPDDRDGVAYDGAISDRTPGLVEGEPGNAVPGGVGAQVDPLAACGLRGHDPGELLAVLDERSSGPRDRAKLVFKGQQRKNTVVDALGSARNRLARNLFAPLGPTYDRVGGLLSLGQDPRWRSFLVSRIEAKPQDVILDVACGTAAVAIELVRRYGCTVVGVDQSRGMIDTGRRRVERAGLAEKIDLVEGRAEQLPFEAEAFDALTFTYLLRYVDEPAETLQELARVVRPGGRIASLEFHVPGRQPERLLWDAYVDIGLPLLGRAVSTGWGEVGSFLGPSIRDFYARYPLPRILELWRSAGIEGVRARTLSLGGGVVIWGVRGY